MNEPYPPRPSYRPRHPQQPLPGYSGPTPRPAPDPHWTPMGATGGRPMPPHPQVGDPSYQPQMPYQAPPPEPRNGFGITAFALALVGLLFCLMPITGFVGFGLGLLALLFACLGLGRVRKGKATNRRLTIAALILAVLATVAGFFAMKTFFDILSDFGKSASPPAAVSGPADPGTSTASDTASSHEFAAGQTVDRDGLQITAGALRKVKPQFGDRLVCTEVTYRNTGADEASFNALDWKIQNPAGVQSTPTVAGDDNLSAGQLAPGGSVTGNVCVTGPGTKGDYRVINAPLLADPICWAAKL